LSTEDAKREVLRHMVATVAYRGRIAMSGAPENFAVFRVNEGARAPGCYLLNVTDSAIANTALIISSFVFASSPKTAKCSLTPPSGKNESSD
jgi:hypothetical protein